MTEERIPFVYVKPSLAKKFSKKMQKVSNIVQKIFPELKNELRMTNLGYKVDLFVTLVTLNATFIMVFMMAFLFFLIWVTDSRTLGQAALFSLGLGLFVFFLIFIVTVRYPKITGGKKAELIEQNLVFALKDLLLQVSAGVPLYDSIVEVSNAGYGFISTEFGKVAKDVQSGIPMDKALEEMSFRSSSEYLKRTVWQIVNVLQSGSDIQTSLKVVIADLLQNHREKIKGYAQELNMWSLVYMLFAVAIPTIGSTVMLIMTSFSGASLTPSIFVVFSLGCLFTQFVIIGLIQSRRPVIDI